MTYAPGDEPESGSGSYQPGERVEEVPEVEPPPGAEVVENMADGSPSVKQDSSGEKYYLRGSTMHDMGFRTESEYVEAQRYNADHALGVHSGKFDEPTYIKVDSGGRPVVRISESVMGKTNQRWWGGEDSPEMRIPITTYDGKEKLLTVKQHQAITDAKTDTEKLDAAIKFKLVPQDTTLKEFTRTAQDIKAEQGASAFEDQQYLKSTVKIPNSDARIAKTDLDKLAKDDFKGYQVLITKGWDAYTRYYEDEKARIMVENADIAVLNAQADRQNKAFDKLKPYTQGEKVDVLKYIRTEPDKNTSTQALIDAGYRYDDVKKWQKQALDPRYLAAEFQARVRETRNDLLKTVKPMAAEDPTSYSMRIDGLAQAEVYKEYSPALQKKITKERFVAAEGLLVPGVETGAHWAYLSTPEKAVAVTLDVAVVATMLWGGRVAGAAIKKLPFSQIKVTERLATVAGKAANTYETARAAQLKNFTTADLTVNRTAIAQEQAAVKTLETKAFKAQVKFLDKFQALKQVTPKELAKIETKSGIKGLKSAVIDVKRAAAELDDAIKYQQKAKFYTNAKTKPQIEANNRHLLRGAEVTSASKKLATALDRAGSTLSPKYKPAILEPPPSQLLERFGEIQASARGRTPLTKDQLSAIGEVQDALSGASKTTRTAKIRTFEQLKVLRDAKLINLEDYEQYLKYLRSQAKIPRATKRTPMPSEKPEQGAISKELKLKLTTDDGTAKALAGKSSPETEAKVRQDLLKGSKESRQKYETELQSQRQEARAAVAEREKLAQEFRKPIPKPVETKPQLKPSDLPKVTPATLSPRPFGLPVKPKQKETAMPQKQGQQEREYGRQEMSDFGTDNTTRTVTEQLVKTKQFQKLSPAEWSQVREMVKAGVNAKAAASVQNLTAAQTKAQIKEAVQQKAEELTKTQTKPMTKTLTKATVITKLITEKPPLKPPFKPPPIKPVIPIPSFGGSDKEKRKAIKDAGGAIAWVQGELNGQNIWHVVKAPYRPKGDHLVVVGKAPEGATLAKGPGEAYKSIITLYGQRPSQSTRFEGGAIDPVVSPIGSGRRVSITFVQDTQYKRPRGRPPIMRPVPRQDIGQGVVETQSGRRHIRIGR